MNELTVPPFTLSGDAPTLGITSEAKSVRAELIGVSSKIVTVSNSEEAELATETSRSIATFLRKLEASRVEAKAPILRAGKLIDSTADDFKKEIEAEKARVDRLITAHARRVEDERRAKENEARRLQAEADRKAAEAERLRVEAAREEQRRLENERAALEKGNQDKESRIAALRAKGEQLQREQEWERQRQDALQTQTEAIVQSAEAVSIASVAGVRVSIDFEVEDMDRLFKFQPKLVVLTPKRREILAFLNQQLSDGLPVGIPGLKIIEVNKVR